MSPTTAGVFRTGVTAAGFVLDLPVIGRDQAVERVLELWQDGARIAELPDGCWLLHLPDAVETRPERAPGLPVRAVGGALVAVGAEDARAGDGELVLPRGGTLHRHRIAALPALTPADWLDLTGLTVRRLAPLTAPVRPEPVADGRPAAAAPDLRAAAGIGPPSERARRQIEPAATDGPRTRAEARRGRRGGAATTGCLLAIAALLAVLSVLTVLRPGAVGTIGLPAVLLVVLACVLAAVSGPRTTDGAAAPSGPPPGTAGAPARPAPARPRPARSRRPRLGGLLARLTMSSPLAALVRGRHARYLDELTRAFEQRRWEDALRDAVQLTRGSAAEGVRLGLGLPERRTGALRPTPSARPGGAAASPLSAPGVHQHLSALYRRAAEALEREGRAEEAAFVLADLLHAAAEAVALLERHGRTAQAAELAEGRDLEAGLQVRLWWLAGDRSRALRIARARGVFADAVDRLAQQDRAAARELREAWAQSCREAGDPLGAAEAAWPEESLRGAVARDLRSAVALAGPTRARALARLLALGAGPATTDLALTVLAGADARHRAERQQLTAALAALPCADPATDRRLATAAARAAVRDGGLGPSVDERTGRGLHAGLLRRADPSAAADLPAPRAPRPTAAGPLEVTAADRPGTLPVRDAVLLGSGSVLVACGQAGVRLLAPDGRTRARWDVPADRLVPADHGGVVLLVARYGEVCEISRLDLATRAVRRWTALRVRQVAGSFDGRLLIVEDEDGIAVLDTLADRPTVVHRELGPDERPVGRIARTASGCTVLVAAGTRLERWRWDLPGWDLRSRHQLDADRPPAGLLGSGPVITVLPATVEAGTSIEWSGEQPTARRALGEVPDPTVLTDGDCHVLAVPGAAGSVRLDAGVGADPTPRCSVLVPAADPAGAGVRQHGGGLTLWHRTGRIVATSDDGRTVLANLRVTAD
ncbi:bpX6 domain-containing protein [Kitasatospora sp. NPDC088346]|uniref:bpX6 domain-containing protein n=1 Tax=Kitasatospora sp. NPDC088346 TaxID=3364073 RepID=UPI00380DF0DF